MLKRYNKCFSRRFSSYWTYRFLLSSSLLSSSSLSLSLSLSLFQGGARRERPRLHPRLGVLPCTRWCVTYIYDSGTMGFWHGNLFRPDIVRPYVEHECITTWRCVTYIHDHFKTFTFCFNFNCIFTKFGKWVFGVLVLLFVCSFKSHSIIFHSFGDVNIAGEGLQFFWHMHMRVLWRVTPTVTGASVHVHLQGPVPLIPNASVRQWTCYFLF